MITPGKFERTTVEWKFELPLDAREISDALIQVERQFTDFEFDDRYKVTSDGTYLIFSWEKSD